MTINITTATIADAPLLSAISKQTFYEAFHDQNTEADMALFLSTHFEEAEILADMADAANTYLLAYSGDAVCGYVKLTNDTSLSTELPEAALRISRIYVLDAYIGKGVGKALMQYCIAEAFQQQKQVIWLGVWEHNLHAIQFYQYWGFEKFGEEIFVLGNDPQTDWLMKKEL